MIRKKLGNGRWDFLVLFTSLFTFAYVWNFSLKKVTKKKKKKALGEGLIIAGVGPVFYNHVFKEDLFHSSRRESFLYFEFP